MATSLWWDEPESSHKADQRNKNDELLVFGYACKLFRDDEKAKDIDKGKLLIPWMGDERLMIDRYDGRGHLYDLAIHDADSVEDKNPMLSEEEEAIEKACDEERYLELNTDLREAQMYEEEEWKRYYLSLQEGYQAVGFSYDHQGGENYGEEQQITEEVKPEETEKPFVVPEELHVPSNMQTPTCGKQNARIEKTASFIAQHGIQMEIMLKAKQAGNSQFDFLHFEDVLNPYYKHVVHMIKSGKYKPQEEEEESKKEDAGSDYLHPSLSSTTQLPPPPPPPSKPIELPKVSIHDTPYGALIKSIRKNTASSITSSAHQVPPSLSSYRLPPSPATSSPYRDNPPPPGTEPVTLPLISSLNGQAFVDQLYNQPPPPGTEDDYSNAPYSSQEHRKRRRSSSSNSSSSSSSRSSSGSSSQRSKKRTSHKSSEVEGPNPIVPPPPNVQPIVDRMAMYVAKNGAEFEMVVMNRRDPRFQFLNEYHAHYPYYKLKKERFLEEIRKSRTEVENQDDKGLNNKQSVSFSIRSRPREQESSQPSGKPRLFEYDSSDGEDKLGEDTMSEGQSGNVTPTARLMVDEDSQHSQKEIEEKLKDKLASAVKERLSQTHKEKQLQLERKRKATMFLNRLKSSHSSASIPSPTLSAHEDVATLYVGEASPAPLVFEYDNRPTPHFVGSKRRKSRSPKERKKRRRSPTPPSAYTLDRRSPARPSPPRWSGRPGTWGGLRDRTPPWQRRSRGDRNVVVRRSRSRSPYRRDEKRKKHKRSKSKSPAKHDRSKDKNRHSREKTKRKSKDQEKKKKEKSRHRSKERDSKHPRGKQSEQEAAGGENSSPSDVEIVEKSPHSHPSPILVENHSQLNNGDERGSQHGAARDVETTLVSGVPIFPSSSADSVTGPSKSLVHSESTDDLLNTASHATSQGNSPTTCTSVSRSSTPSRSSTDATSATPSDLMSKVRAMLKKSREMILKEEGFAVEDT